MLPVCGAAAAGRARVGALRWGRDRSRTWSRAMRGGSRCAGFPLVRDLCMWGSPSPGHSGARGSPSRGLSRCKAWPRARLLSSPGSRQHADPAPLPPGRPHRAPADPARPGAEHGAAVPALAALPALPAGASGRPGRRYGLFSGMGPPCPLGEPWQGTPRPRDRPTRVSSNRWHPAGIHGLQLDFLELGSNRVGWLQVWQRHQAPGDVPVSAGHAAGMGMGGGAALTPCSP